ncbi:MAG: hypothetical protein H5T80_15355 [Dietzia sp.]|nr:hypothetical protein [Dietzia sp.]
MSTDPTTNDHDDDTTSELIEVEALALEAVKLADEQAAITERIDTIKARLLTILPPGTHQAGPYRVQVKAGPRRLDTTALEAAYPVIEHPELYSPKPDTAKVKHHLAPAVLDGFYVEGRPQVVIQ